VEDAVQVCRIGLARHPEYPSARLTLGRALVTLGHVDDAREEFERVIRDAPDNLAALRAIDELRRMGITPKTQSTEPALSELEHWLAAIAAESCRAGIAPRAWRNPAIGMSRRHVAS
jgi:hypothetical protein